MKLLDEEVKPEDVKCESKLFFKTCATFHLVIARDGVKATCSCRKRPVLSNDKCGEGLFEMPRVPKKTPEKKGRAKDEEMDGNVEGGQKGKKVRTSLSMSLSLSLSISLSYRLYCLDCIVVMLMWGW